jgi:uncharacterized protein
MMDCRGWTWTKSLALLAAGAWAAAGIAAETAGSGKPFVWEVRSDTSTSYLMGSLHAAKPDIYPLHPTVYEAFDSVPVLVVEADVDAVSPARITGMVLGRALNLSGRSLSDRLSPEGLEALAGVAGKHGLSVGDMSRFEPWYVAQLITVLELATMGIDPEQGIEKHLLRRGRDTKEILELEGLEAQLNFLDGFSDREQDLMLQYTLRDLDNIGSLMDEIAGAWKAGDPERLDTLLNGYVKDSQGLEEVFEKLFTERNHTMAAKIRGHLASNRNHFIIVGAGHLVGEKGLLQSLANDGYRLRQLEEPPPPFPATDPDFNPIAGCAHNPDAWHSRVAAGVVRGFGCQGGVGDVYWASLSCLRIPICTLIGFSRTATWRRCFCGPGRRVWTG